MSSVPILLFASYADALGARRVDAPVPLPGPVSALVAAVRALPGGQVIPATPLVAVNHVWVDADYVVREGDEVAIIPPVAGG